MQGANTDVLVLPMDPSLHIYAIEVLKKIKDQGLKADIYLETGKFKKKMNYADKIGAKYAIIIGQEEADNKEVSIKNMESGEQTKQKIEDLHIGN